MFRKVLLLGVICLCTVFKGCGILPEKKDAVEAQLEKRAVEKAVYQPYEKRNTIEGYAEFIEKNPDSHMIHIALQQIDDLRYAPYEGQHAIAGYSEFIVNNPTNRNVAAARRNIETLAFQESEGKDSIEGYSEFLATYPRSHFNCEAKDRLHELKFRQFHEQIEGTYRFDLLLYRLALKRRQNELNTEGKNELADFKCTASFVNFKGATYFNTQLIYRNDSIRETIVSEEVSGELFDNLLSEALTYLYSKFRGKSKISGFSFEVTISPFGFCKEPVRIIHYYFPMAAVGRFSRGMMNRAELLTGVITDIP